MRTRTRTWLLASTLAALGLAPLHSQTPAPQKPDKVEVAVQAGRLIDGVGASARERVTVLVGAGKVIAVQDGWQAPQGATVIDLRTSTVMPGLIDAHTHITGEGTGNAIVRTATETPLDAAVRSTLYARRTLEAGFTTIRNVGAEGGADVALKRAIEAGLVPGPRIWTARTTISITGGHGDQGGLRPDLWVAPTWMDGIVDSADEARKAVRYQHKYGADLIKITATGGVLSIGDSGDAQQFTDEEMRAIVDAAHLLGMKVAAHAHGKRGIEAGHSRRRRFHRARHVQRRRDVCAVQGARHLSGADDPGGEDRGGDGDDSRSLPSDRRSVKAAAIGPLIQDMFKRALRGRREDRVRHRLRRLEPRRERPRVRLHGGGRHAADGGDPFRDAGGPQTCWALRIASGPSSRAGLPISSPWPGIR